MKVQSQIFGRLTHANRRMASARSNSDTTEIARTCATRLPPAADGRGTRPGRSSSSAAPEVFAATDRFESRAQRSDPRSELDKRNSQIPACAWERKLRSDTRIEEEPEPLALDDQRVEGGQDMNLFLRRIGNGSRVSGRTQCSDWPAPSSCTVISSFRRTRDSTRGLIASLRGASR